MIATTLFKAKKAPRQKLPSYLELQMNAILMLSTLRCKQDVGHDPRKTPLCYLTHVNSPDAWHAHVHVAHTIVNW